VRARGSCRNAPESACQASHRRKSAVKARRLRRTTGRVLNRFSSSPHWTLSCAQLSEDFYPARGWFAPFEMTAQPGRKYLLTSSGVINGSSIWIICPIFRRVSSAQANPPCVFRPVGWRS
jgi:hypothetical protein